MKTGALLRFAVSLLTFPFWLIVNAAAHCDALDGPVVEAARLAIMKGDVTRVLRWVDKAGEKEIREAFALTMKVRSQGDDARKLADMRFFETLVRVHRAAGLRQRFAAVIEKQKHADDSVEAGRAYVAAYVDYAHFIDESNHHD